jgi:hypothetical protein
VAVLAAAAPIAPAPPPAQQLPLLLALLRAGAGAAGVAAAPAPAPAPPAAAAAAAAATAGARALRRAAGGAATVGASRAPAAAAAAARVCGAQNMLAGEARFLPALSLPPPACLVAGALVRSRGMMRARGLQEWLICVDASTLCCVVRDDGVVDRLSFCTSGARSVFEEGRSKRLLEDGRVVEARLRRTTASRTT